MSLPGLAPVVTVLILSELAIGTLVVTLLADLSGEVGRGFLGTTALICLAIIGIDVALLAVLPDPADLLHHPVDSGRFRALQQWTVAFAAAVAAYALFCAIGTDIARRVLGVATVIVGAVTVGRACAVFESPLLGGFAGVATFVPATLLAGSTLAAMLLGHWYLIAPNLSFRPLRRGVYLIFVSTAIQSAAVALGLVTASSGTRHDLLAGQYGASFWLLVVSAGLVVTLGINGLTLHYARMRANQPATAMLYILVIAVLMGLVPGHLLYFLTEVPV